MASNGKKNLITALLLISPFLIMAHGVSSADQETLNNGGLLSYIYVGAKHMVTGYDHLLFLAGVIFYLNGFKDILRFITVFTIGHSITLIGATYLSIKANEHLIDAVIALSVFYKGFENLGGFEKYFTQPVIDGLHLRIDPWIRAVDPFTILRCGYLAVFIENNKFQYWC